MHGELVTQLRDSAPVPTGPLDVDDVRRRAGRLRRGRRRATALCLAAALLPVVALGIPRLDGPSIALVTPPTSLEEGSWRPMSEAPLGERQEAVTVWTGEELVVWGGASSSLDVTYDDGAAYDPETDVWRSLADAPVDGLWGATSAWTGTEVLVVGNADGDTGEVSAAVVAVAYDPAADRWRTLPTPPSGTGTGGHTALWSGDELLVWGAAGRQGRPGAAYDPLTDRWRDLPPAPEGAVRTGHAAVWTGSEMLVWGGYGPGATLRDDGYALDPATGAWRRLADGPVPGRGSPAAAWTGSRMLVWGGSTMDAATGSSASSPVGPLTSTEVAAYDPVTDRWTVGTPSPHPSRPQGPVVWTGRELAVVSNRAEALAYDPIVDEWTRLPDDPVLLALGSGWVWTGDALLAWGGIPVSATGQGAVLHADGS